MRLLMFGKNSCPICNDKAYPILSKLGVPLEKVSIDPDDYDLTDQKQRNALTVVMSDFAFYDGSADTKLPLVIAFCKGCDEELGRWTGVDIANPDEPWTPIIKNFVKHNHDCKKDKKEKK